MRGLRLGLGTTRAPRKGGGLPWYPNRLFQSGDILLWYDPSDLTTMFKDTVGTQPVTADGDSVALMLDKGQWGGKTLEQVLAAQPELVTNGGFDSDLTGWTASDAGSGASSTWDAGRMALPRIDGSNLARRTQALTTVAGRMYRVTFVVPNAGGWIRVGTSAAGNNVMGDVSFAAGTRQVVFLASSSTSWIMFYGNTNGSTLYIDDVSSKEIPGYHRIQATGTSMPKYKTDGTLHWLLYDGTDDGHATGTITWGTDEVAICAGVTKSSDATGMIAELSASASANNGAFALYNFVTDQKFYSQSRGTLSTNSGSPAFAAPVTSILTALADISADSNTIRIDGSQSTVGTDQGTGNYGSYPLYFGRRGGSTLPFNGREYQTVIRSRLLSAAELANLETFVAAKTGVIL